MNFMDLAAQQQRIKDIIDKNIAKVLSHGQYIMGPEIRELEEKLAAYVGVKHAVGCASGTDALLMALMAYGVGPGDAIFTTPFTFVATAEVISLLGATPVFVDIDPVTFNIDPVKLEQAILALQMRDSSHHPLPGVIVPAAADGDVMAVASSSNSVGVGEGDGDGKLESFPRSEAFGLRPKGIIAVDLFGLPADYDVINAIARRHDLFVIEDAAQSFGAEYQGRKACSLADIACTSFFPAKPLGGYGDGGMLFTNDDELVNVLRSIRVHGQGSDKYENVRIGINGRLDTLQAAILLAKFAIFPEEVEMRQAVAERYRMLLTADTPAGCTGTSAMAVIPPKVSSGYKSVWAQYSILAKDEGGRARLQEALKSAGIPTAIYYPRPLHLQGAFAALGYKSGDFPVSEEMAGRIFSLPMHPYLDGGDQELICRHLMVSL
ncbi:MAG: DegT/DnrJ/EryC1/StrS family aminotransferase [Deltaproteobacteria bacterium]|nr:DegT/DnrJ/EryC1/StrS family aminotransferase [Deltaproteobacteria bacterium]